ncbi:MAG: RNA polymerase sigma factor [Prevotella sp.]
MKNEDITSLKFHDPDKAFRMLFDKYKEPLYWHIRRLVVSHADAEDAVQNTFVRIYRSLGTLKKADSLVAWVYRIATNEALRVIKDEKLVLSRLDEPEAGEVKADDYVDYSDLEAVRLQKAILSLPQKQRIAFTMRYYDNLDFSDIAKVTGSSAASAKVNYHVAKDKIISYMTSTD